MTAATDSLATRYACPACGDDACPYKYCAERIRNAEATSRDQEFLFGYNRHKRQVPA